MPRKAKTRPTQPIAAPQEQGYGVRGQQIAAQGAMPLPDNRSPSPVAARGVAAAAATPPEAVPGQPAPAPATPEDIQRMLQEMAPPPAGGLARPTERPGEPVVQGVGQPQVTRNVAAETLDAIAQATGDPRFSVLAARARSL